MAEPWFRAHAQLHDKHVVKRVASAVGVSLATAAGHLVFLWGALSERASRGEIIDGNIARISDDEIERMAHWTGAPYAFARVIREKHCNEKGQIHEWQTYMGTLVEKRANQRARVARYRQSLPAPASRGGEG